MTLYSVHLWVMIIDQVEIYSVCPHGEECITIATVVKVTTDLRQHQRPGIDSL